MQVRLTLPFFRLEHPYDPAEDSRWIDFTQSRRDLYRLKGELLLQKDGRAEQEAEALFHRALEVAGVQKMKSVELCAAMSLARLWQKQGKKEDARALLAPIYDWFTEGFDTPDLKDAKALLDELS